MRFALTEEQTALRDAVRALLAAECPPEVVRSAWPDFATRRNADTAGTAGPGSRRSDAGAAGGPEPIDRLWAHLAGTGVLGAGLPEDSGGMGLTEIDLSPLLTEVGYAAVPLPVAETMAVAGPLLAAIGDPDGWLAGLVGGAVRVAIVGATGLIPYGEHADLLLVLGDGVARLAARDTVTAAPVSTVDGSRAALRLDGDPATIGAALPVDADLVTLSLDRATVAAAAQLVGLGRRMLDLTVGYVCERHQFGVPVGGFQAVKHQLADALLRLEFAAPAVLRAAWSMATGAGQRRVDVSMAYLLAAEAAELTARTAIQCHGAIGYTVEYDLHLYAKRVWALTAEGGGLDAHLDRLGTALGLPPAVASMGGSRSDR